MTNPTEPSKPWLVPGKWNVSLYNFRPEVRQQFHLPSRVRIHDATLRDGEQSPGVVFRKDEKLRLAHELADLGVDRIEGSMVGVSEEDNEALTAMAHEIESAEICAFARARRDDMELCLKVGVQRAIVEVNCDRAFVNRVWGSPEKAAETFVDLSHFAAGRGLKVTLFLMESTRSDLDLLEAIIVPSARNGKVDSVALADSRGSCLPWAMQWLVGTVKSWVDLPVEVHAHDTWGVGTASALGGVIAGAEVVHTAINGLNANAALDECIVGLHALLNVPTNVRMEGLTALSQLAREYSGANWFKPFVGEGVAAVEVGIATRNMWERRTDIGFGRAEFLNHEVVGGKACELVLGKKSGTYSILLKAYELGMPIPTEDQAKEILQRVKLTSSAQKRAITEDEFREYYAQIVGAASGKPVDAHTFTSGRRAVRIGNSSPTLLS